jgi:DNA topoisomerase-2
MIFVNVCLNRPEFESQSKNQLESKVTVPKIKDLYLKKMLKWDIIDYVKRLKEITSLKKMERPKNNKFIKVDGFDPANNEGTSKSIECTLILVEGLSAKTFAVQGIQSGAFGKKGRDWFGIYPLRGKLLNVRNAKTTSITKNKVISNIITILGISTSKDYTKEENYKTLRYGRVMMLCDADVDGIHITGLIQNLFHFMYPTILKREQPFLTSMQTPIVKVFIGKKELVFYNEDVYKEYEKKHKNVKNKYYKGLGSSSQKDIKEVFGKKLINFKLDNTTDNDMDKVFNKNCSDQRKQWLVQDSKYGNINWTNDSTIEEIKEISMSHYLNNEVKKFSISDCQRSIPHIMDGLKESQRKVLYACFLKNLNYKGKTLKVAQLAGFVAEKTAYHHGEQNLYDTITRMANDYVGSNNIPYLYRDGQFGTRIENGKDAANARYIFTKLDRLTRLLFKQEDDELLEHVIDDGDEVEPINYVPIIPTVLVNGCSSGIGTGWSSSIPCYNPKDLIECMRAWIKNKEFPEIHPWYNNYVGEISKINDKKYSSKGVLERNSKKKNTVIVKELPIGMWTSDFKESLYTLVEKKYIKNVKNYSTPSKIDIHIIEDKCGKSCTLDNLHLFKYIHTSNMVLFTKNGIQKFNHINEILNYFCKERYELYVVRKKNMLSKLEKNIIILDNKYKFLTEIMNDTFKLFEKTTEGRVSRTIESIETELVEKKYNMTYGYDYMIKMQFRNMTKKSMDELMKEINDIKSKYEKIKSISEKKMWLNDLKYLENSI